MRNIFLIMMAFGMISSIEAFGSSDENKGPSEVVVVEEMITEIPMVDEEDKADNQKEKKDWMDMTDEEKEARKAAWKSMSSEEKAAKIAARMERWKNMSEEERAAKKAKWMAKMAEPLPAGDPKDNKILNKILCKSISRLQMLLNGRLKNFSDLQQIYQNSVDQLIKYRKDKGFSEECPAGKRMGGGFFSGGK